MRQMSKNNFKINVHDTLLRILSGENDYIDLPDLTTNFLKTRLLTFAMYMIVNLIKLNLFVYLFNILYSFSLVFHVIYLYIYYIWVTTARLD